jgi:NADH-quinone oxidoreductase subunit H
MLNVIFILGIIAGAIGLVTGLITGGVYLFESLPAAVVIPGWVIAILKISIIVFGFVMLLSSLLTLFGDRKQSAKIQNRIGPNRASILGFSFAGLPHFIADGIKMIFKEDIRPDGANKVLHTIAPALMLIPALLGWAVIPFMDKYCTGSVELRASYPYEICTNGTWETYFQIVDFNSGLLYAFAIAGISVYGAAIAGWASNNKFSLLGALRSAAQMISYEVALGLSLAGVLMIYGTLDLNEMARLQGQMLGGWVPMWGIVMQPIAFFMFFLAGMAETKRAPFDLPEGESELVAGYYTEYSTMKFGVIEVSEYAATVFLAALTALLFLGGWQVPYLFADGFHFGGVQPGQPDIALSYQLVIGLRVAAMMFKIIVLVWLQFMMRWTLPRFRYDQVMTLGWKVLLPLSLANLAITGIIVALI